MENQFVTSLSGGLALGLIAFGLLGLLIALLPLIVWIRFAKSRVPSDLLILGTIVIVGIIIGVVLYMWINGMFLNFWLVDIWLSGFTNIGKLFVN